MYKWREHFRSVRGELPDCDPDALRGGLDTIYLRLASRRVETYKVSRKRMFALAKSALKKIEQAIADLESGHTHDVFDYDAVSGEDVERQWHDPWSEEIEAGLDAQAEKLRAAIDAGGPNPGKPIDALLHPTILELADLYESLTENRATAGGTQPTPFQRFALAAMAAFGKTIDLQVVVRALKKRPRKAK